MDPTVGPRGPTFGGASDVCRDGPKVDLGMPITDKMDPLRFPRGGGELGADYSLISKRIL
jgi:hypothetical protein